jgi:hypothetical protein
MKLFCSINSTFISFLYNNLQVEQKGGVIVWYVLVLQYLKAAIWWKTLKHFRIRDAVHHLLCVTHRLFAFIAVLPKYDKYLLRLDLLFLLFPVYYRIRLHFWKVQILLITYGKCFISDISSKIQIEIRPPKPRTTYLELRWLFTRKSGSVQYSPLPSSPPPTASWEPSPPPPLLGIANV